MTRLGYDDTLKFVGSMTSMNAKATKDDRVSGQKRKQRDRD